MAERLSAQGVGGVLLVRVASHRHQQHPRHRHPPLNLWYARAGLQAAGLEVSLWDQWVEPAAAPPLEPFAAVAILAQSEARGEAAALAERARAAGLLTLCVGQHAQHYPTGAPCWDAVILGEFEQALGGRVQQLLGRGGAIPTASVSHALVETPAALPLLAPSRAELQRYPFPLPVRGRVVRLWGYVQTAWGCPYACAHCTEVVRKSSGSRLRRRPVTAVLDEIELQLAAGAEGIVFEDDTLLCSPAHFEALCAGIAARRLRFAWIANARPDELDSRRVALAAEAGAVLLKLGIETADSALAQRIGKCHGGEPWRERCEAGLARLQRAGIGALALVMTGLPGETRAIHRATAAWLRRQPLDYLQVQLFTAYPDVALTAADASERLLSHYAAGHSAERRGFAAWQRRLYRVFYLRLGFVWRHLRHSWRWYLRPAHWRGLRQQAGFVLGVRRVD